MVCREKCLNTTSLQARDLGFQAAAKRIEELQAVVGKYAEDAASGNDSPVGIPPQRAKPAGVKPDPKARPFTPGMGLCTDYVHQCRLAEDWLVYTATYTSASTNAQTADEASA